ncbi:MAG: hypothetical protein ABI821_12945 [Pseudomonadota bacterium]
MKTPVLCVLALAFGLLAPGGVTLSDEQKPATAGPKLNVSSKITTSVALPANKQLYKPGSSMKISKDSPPKVLVLPMRSDAIPTFDPISADLEAFKRAVAVDHEAKAAFSAKARECWDRDYTQADQAAAGCRATETVAVCYEKLATACVTPALVSSRNASSALESAHSKLKNTLVGYMQRLNR